MPTHLISNTRPAENEGELSRSAQQQRLSSRAQPRDPQLFFSRQSAM